MHTIKNLTNSPHDLSIRLPAGGSVTAVFAPEYLVAYEASGYFEVSAVESPVLVVPEPDPLDHDADGTKGGSAPVDEPDDTEASTVALMLETSAEDVAAFVDGDDRPSDAVLRAYIEAKTGKRAHPNAKTDTLVEKVKEAAQAAA